MKGFKRQTAESGKNTRLPMTPQILRAIKQVWQGDKDRDKVSTFGRQCAFVFSASLGQGKLLSRQIPSTIPQPTFHTGTFAWTMQLIHSSSRSRLKPDTFRKGVQIYLGRTDSDLCPVAATLNYMVRRGNDSGPFFRYSRSRFLTRERFVSEVRRALAAAGIDSSKYAGHSFRIVAASTAARCGLQDSLIKTLGRWESFAYTLYVRTSREELCSVSQVLATQQ